MIDVWLPFWSYMLAYSSCISMVGVSDCMSLFGLHSCTDSCRLVILRGGCIYLLYLDWV